MDLPIGNELLDRCPGNGQFEYFRAGPKRLILGWHRACLYIGMIDTLLIILTLVVGGLVYVLFAAARAPQGYQDGSGFHFGPDEPESLEDLDEAVTELTR